jgi:hypothetical protein
VPNAKAYRFGQYHIVANIQTAPHKMINVLFVQAENKGSGEFAGLLDFLKKEFEIVAFNSVLRYRFRAYLARNGFCDGGEGLGYNMLYVRDGVDDVKVMVLDNKMKGDE